MSKLPIKTIREGNKITKVCVEDIYKIINRIQEAMDKAHNNSIDIIDSINKSVDGWKGELIIGTGISQPCANDTFDEETGMNIAFMKAKLNANLKKRNILRRILRQYTILFMSIDDELANVERYIDMDIEGIREYNPYYLQDEEIEETEA